MKSKPRADWALISGLSKVFNRQCQEKSLTSGARQVFDLPFTPKLNRVYDPSAEVEDLTMGTEWRQVRDLPRTSKSETCRPTETPIKDWRRSPPD